MLLSVHCALLRPMLSSLTISYELSKANRRLKTSWFSRQKPNLPNQKMILLSKDKIQRKEARSMPIGKDRINRWSVHYVSSFRHLMRWIKTSWPWSVSVLWRSSGASKYQWSCSSFLPQSWAVPVFCSSKSWTLWFKWETLASTGPNCYSWVHWPHSQLTRSFNSSTKRSNCMISSRWFPLIRLLWWSHG